ncbi:DUF2267 domain-containing protein [Streptomyces sp. NPDC095817]|uniref:DUF2267 domain-containing protein n=1 Tax=Streptomyces sp. NPDC095817 TaxID=3155082 RepID=UPI003316FEDB
MLSLREPASAPTGMTFHHILEKIRYEGAYPTREQAEDVTRTVLQALGSQLAMEERTELAACLPIEAAQALTSQTPNRQPLTGWGFVKNLSIHTGTTPATARWDTGAVLATVGRLAGPDLLARILHQLPEGYALLFGQAELRRREPAAA